MESPFTELGKSMKETDLRGKTRVSLDMITSRCLVNIQVELEST